MEIHLLLVLLFCVKCSLAVKTTGNLGPGLNPNTQLNEEDLNNIYQKYIKDYAKQYTNEGEYEMRKKIFGENLKMIEQHNQQNVSYKMKLNHFADNTPEELNSFSYSLPDADVSMVEGAHSFPYSDKKIKQLAEGLPKSFDMRKQGYISPVKNQEQCGSCWAFCALGAVEGALRRKYGKDVVLSEQALVDCV